MSIHDHDGIVTFDTTADIHQYFAEVEQNNARLDSLVQPWQAALQDDDSYYHITEMGGELLGIYGFIEPVTNAEDRQVMAARPNLRMVRAYSAVCPDGEAGTEHIATFALALSHVELLAAACAGWPRDIRTLGGRFAGLEIVQLQ